MSGGSFDYLEHRQGTVEEYDQVRLEALDRGASVDSKAILDLHTLVLALKDVERLRMKLEPVIHAVEWTVSCDWCDDQMLEAFWKYERGEL